ncbi:MULTISPECIES: PLP-dependent aspartate aminotransferase family protein [unclassified Leisingera]|nr:MULTISPECIES: PLP-dependent aspartate aminotransferase family protein [unclassified Leisingera]MCF6430214.1 PLP-dependent aspartate aminotransferase family protein [Leisingera sp. MMG026]
MRPDPAQEAEYRIYAGDGIFRLSAVLEDTEDLIAARNRLL